MGERDRERRRVHNIYFAWLCCLMVPDIQHSKTLCFQIMMKTPQQPQLNFNLGPLKPYFAHKKQGIKSKSDIYSREVFFFSFAFAIIDKMSQGATHQSAQSQFVSTVTTLPVFCLSLSRVFNISDFSSSSYTTTTTATTNGLKRE